VQVDRKAEADFEAFVAAVGSRLLRVAYLLTGDLGQAEDLVQVTLERTALRWRRLEGAPEAFARQVLANAATDGWRRRRVRVTEVAITGTDVASVSDVAGRVALHRTLVDALRRLPPRQRAVLVLRYFEDLPEAEVAQILAISRGTVKSTASRALSRLRTLVPELVEELS
jgi:RNA polymerase sigma-70 factor (sigma-E family)